MGLKSLGGSGVNVEDAKRDRESRLNPPEFAPGQGPDADISLDSLFDDDIGLGDGGGLDLTDILGDSTGGYPNMGQGGYGGMGVPVQGGYGGVPMQGGYSQGKSTEDAIFDGLKTGLKGAGGFLKEFSGSFSKLTPRWYSEWGRVGTFSGAGLSVGGLAFWAFGKGFGFSFLIAGLITMAWGFPLWFILSDMYRSCQELYKDEPAGGMGVDAGDDFGGDLGMGDFVGVDSDFGGDSFDFGGTSGFMDDKNDTGLDDLLRSFGGSDDVVDTPRVVEGDLSLNGVVEIKHGFAERRYLYNMFRKALPSLCPGFAEMREVGDSEALFYDWENKLHEASKVSGCKDLPELLKLEENLFTIVVTCSRPQGFKAEQVADELANIYAFRDGRVRDTKVFAKVDTFGLKCVITLFTGDTAMISLRDMMEAEESFILDESNIIPVIFGVNELGEVIKEDLRKLESLIVTGMPRKGKSWFVQALVTQVCAYLSPKELELYIMDPKDEISDYKEFAQLPHVKLFSTEDSEVLECLRHLVRVEGPRRSKIIGGAGCVNIWDFKRKNPDVDMPIIYLVIDEIITIASRMQKDTHAEFRSYLRELISRLPSLGIRAILIPHILNNDIIEKKTSSLVPCKVSVGGDAEHIEAATGSKPREFPFRLVNIGDMAMKLSGYANTLFVHAPVLTPTNEGNVGLFEYMNKFWNKVMGMDESSSGSDSVSVSDDGYSDFDFDDFDDGFV